MFVFSVFGVSVFSVFYQGLPDFLGSMVVQRRHGHETIRKIRELYATVLNKPLDIIEEESLRLSALATNVLNLAKVENQNILSDTTDFNLSEQIRNCFLLLETKWSKKNIDPLLPEKEYEESLNKARAVLNALELSGKEAES